MWGTADPAVLFFLSGGGNGFGFPFRRDIEAPGPLMKGGSGFFMDGRYEKPVLHDKKMQGSYI